MRGYPEYTSTNIKWMEFIPAHWDSMKAKFLIDKKIVDNVGHEWTSTPLLSLTQRGVILKDINEGKGKTHSDYTTYQKVEQGELVFCLFDMDETPRTVGLSTHKGMITSAYSVFQAKKGCSNKYIYYFFESIDDCKGLKPYYSGLRKTVRPPEFLQVFIPKPPFEDQVAIAKYLDRETARIDKLIAEKQNFIKLLKEKRQALISHVVTKGLDTNVKMKDSGIEWIGEVPEHWAISKLSYRYEVLLGKMLDDKKITGEYLGRYLRNTDVQWDCINDKNLPLMDFKPGEIERYQVVKGDLLVCEGGEVGRCAIWEKDEPCFYQKALHRLRPYSKSKDFIRFIFYVISDAVHKERFISRANKSTIAHLPADAFRQYRFAFPDINEQKQIAIYLDREKNKYDEFVNEVNSSVELLKEHRTALISAVVTGKIDVRNA